MKCKTTKTNDFEEYETNIDASIIGLELSQYPLNNMIDWLNFCIALQYSGEQLNTTSYNSDSTKTHISAALSYIFPLLNDCDKEYNMNPYETVFNHELKNKLKDLINYGGFCEIAPYVWKDIYKYSINNKIIRITYSEDYYKYELKDTVLTSISLGVSATDDISTSNVYDLHVQDIANYNSGANPSHLVFETITSKKWYKEHRFDDLFVSENIYNELGITKKDYIEFQSFWLGITTYYIKTFEAIIRYFKRTNNQQNTFINNALYHVSSPNIKKDKFYNIFKEELIGLPKEKFNVLMDIFSLKIDEKFKIQDGHYPVFIEYNDLYMFSPFNVRVQMSPRNLLYLLNKKKPDFFNNKISNHLEPELIKNCITLLSKITSLDIKVNIEWANGEFDILAYDAISNSIMHIQAKASIPVEGARMTRNLESRIEEGVKQILTFNKEIDSNKEMISSSVFQKDIKNPNYINIIIGWGGFGTYKSWHKLETNNIVALNMAVLNQYIIKFKDNYNLLNFYNDIQEIIQEMIDITEPKKVTHKYKIDKYKINYESFEYKESKLIRYRYIP